jgi:hypothetical protein
LIDVNFVFSLAPIPFTTAMIAREMAYRDQSIFDCGRARLIGPEFWNQLGHGEKAAPDVITEGKLPRAFVKSGLTML